MNRASPATTSPAPATTGTRAIAPALPGDDPALAAPARPGGLDPRLGVLLIAPAAVLWGTFGVTTRAIYGLAEPNALLVGSLRLAIAAPVLLALCRLVVGPRAFAVDRRDLAVMALLGGTMAGYQLFFLAAVGLAGVAIPTLVTLCLAPVLVVLLSGVVLRERPGRGARLALPCALAGTALLVGVTPGDAERQPGVLTGALLALGSAAGYALFLLAGRRLAGRYHPLQPIGIGFSVGALGLLPIAWLAGSLDGWQAVPAPAWGLLVYLGLGPTALAYIAFLLGLRHTTASAASIVTLIEPLTATLLAWLLFGEALAPHALLGAALLLGGILLLTLLPATPERG